MFARAVSIVLIAAVVACPMWCGNGVCHAGQCSAADACGMEDQTSQVACPLQEAIDCCGKPTLPGGNARNRHQCPENHQCPDKLSCQGICGGAVFERACELAGAEIPLYLPLRDSDDLVVSLLAHLHAFGAEHVYHNGAKNGGRLLRTLHSSFLC